MNVAGKCMFGRRSRICFTGKVETDGNICLMFTPID